MKKKSVNKGFWLTYYDNKDTKFYEFFNTEKELNNFVKKNAKNIGYFYVDIRLVSNINGKEVIEIFESGKQYIGSILSERQVDMRRIWNDDMACVLDNDIESYVQISNGDVYPVYIGEKVFDKKFNQIYPAVEMSVVPVEMLKEKSR